MVRTKFDVVLKRTPSSPTKKHRVIRTEIRKRLNEVGKSHVRSRQKVVSNWSERTKPTFNHKVIVSQRKLEMKIGVKEKSKPFWRWVDQGTRAHPIAARNAPYLVFRGGGVAKTQANPARFGRGAVAMGRFSQVKRVWHPGTKARNFSKAINKDLKPDELKAIQNGVRAGFRKVNR